MQQNVFKRGPQGPASKKFRCGPGGLGGPGGSRGLSGGRFKTRKNEKNVLKLYVKPKAYNAIASRIMGRRL